MDLFAAVAERLEDPPFDIRPLMPTPFTPVRDSLGFDELTEEIEIGAPPTPRNRRMPAERPEPTIPPSEGEPGASRAELPPEPTRAAPQPVQGVDAPPPEGPKARTTEAPHRGAPVTPEVRATASHAEPGETQAPIRIEPAEPPLLAEPAIASEEAAPSPAPADPAIHNEVHHHIHATTFENQHLTVQQIETGPTIANTNVFTNIHQGGPHIVIPPRPIEVAVHPESRLTTVVRESGSSPMEAERKWGASENRETETPRSRIDIRIGHIEVNAARPTNAPKPPTPRAAPRGLTLDEILKKRGAT